MNGKVRVILFLHALIATYCIACGVLDATGYFHPSLIPSVAIFYLLAASAVVLPLIAAATIIGTRQKDPVVLIVAHLVMGAGQLCVGLFPLIT